MYEFQDPLFADTDKKLLQRFSEFHEANPDIYAAFAEHARQMKEKRSTYSAWAIASVIRWHRDLNTTDGEFKLNNNYVGLYARLLVVRDPSFQDFFEFRSMKPVLAESIGGDDV